MFDNTNPYKIFCRYYAAFKDGQGNSVETEISKEVFDEFSRFIKTERNLHRADERHNEYLELTEEEIHRRSGKLPLSLDDIVANKELEAQVQQIVGVLPEVQRRRFLLYYKYELTYKQIAEVEGCTFQAVAKSISVVKTRLKNNFD